MQSLQARRDSCWRERSADFILQACGVGESGLVIFLRFLAVRTFLRVKTRAPELPASPRVDFPDGCRHIERMDFDISRLLDDWDYKPGQMVVRKFTGKDGAEKIQLRLDLGVLQMNASGRPDGKRPFGYPSLLEFHRARLHKHVGEHGGSDDGFALDAEACAKLQMEALQYHHRYICLLELGDYHAVIRDTERNLEVFEFADKQAESDELSWALQQFRPQLLMVQARARATLELEADDFKGALSEIDASLEKIRQFYCDYSREDYLEDSPEIASLENWREEINQKRPLSKKEKLEHALNDAVQREDYEKAAQVRDALRNLKTGDA